MPLVPILTERDRLFAFLVLASPFYLNDFGFILLNGTYGVYLLDYLTRALVLTACFSWGVSRSIAYEQSTQPFQLEYVVIAILGLPIIDLIIRIWLENFGVIQGVAPGLFQYDEIENTILRTLDISIGLFVVALSEELVFRKFALSWLRSYGRSATEIIVTSACFFALAHWGRGLVGVVLTFFFGLLYMVAYLKMGRLWPLVLAHWIQDFIVFS